MITKSKAAFDDAQHILVGGVNSPVRAFKSVGGTPIFMKKAKGPYLYDEDGNTYIDLIQSWGPMILGHANDAVTEALIAAVKNGTSFGTPGTLETQLAEKIQSFMPNLEKIRFVNSGTEASMSALRLARGYTNRELIIKFDGCYHGHVDPLLVAAGSGALTHGTPDSAGIPQSTVDKTIVLPYNNIDVLKSCFETHGKDIAAVIVEPVAGNMGCVPPNPGFLSTLRAACTDTGALLIFDEVMTGFRVALNGAQGLFNIKPDLSCLGKVIGGGLPVGAYGGRADIMEQLSPMGSVYQAGTLSGNPVAMSAGIATLNQLNNERFTQIVETTQFLANGLKKLIQDKQLSASVNSIGSMFSLFFTKTPVTDLATAKTADTEQFATFFHHMLKNGVYWAPSQFESCFLSTAHTRLQLAQVLDTTAKFFD